MALAFTGCSDCFVAPLKRTLPETVHEFSHRVDRCCHCFALQPDLQHRQSRHTARQGWSTTHAVCMCCSGHWDHCHAGFVELFWDGAARSDVNMDFGECRADATRAPGTTRSSSLCGKPAHSDSMSCQSMAAPPRSPLSSGAPSAGFQMPSCSQNRKLFRARGPRVGQHHRDL